MKRIMSLLSVLTLSFTLISGFSAKSVSASELDSYELPKISEEQLEILADELGQEFADEQNNKRITSGSRPLNSSYDETWTIERKHKLVPQSVVATRYKDLLMVNQSREITSSFTFAVGGIVKGVKLDMSFTSTRKDMRKGPSSTDKLSNGVKATHTVISSVQQGAIYQYQYRVVDAFTGKFLRYEYRNGMVDCGNVSYAQLANIGNTVTIESANTYNLKKASNITVIKNSMNSNNPTYILF